MAIKVYDLQFIKAVADIFETKQHFMRTFGGSLQTATGAEYNKDFMKLKISDTDVVVQEYSTDENVAFGSGTGNSNRFGPRKEIISIDANVQYDKPLAIHEGVDRFTVNDSVEQIIRERAGLHAQTWIEELNKYMSKKLSDNAGKTLNSTMDEEGISKLFYEARKEMINNKVSTSLNWVAYVTPEVFNILVDSKLATTAKNSNTVNIERQELYMYKGFILVELPEEYFQEGDIAVFAPDNVGVIALALETYRVIESADFNGYAIQGAGKTASYIPEKNKKAILRAQVGA